MRAIRRFVFDHHGRERGVRRYVFVTNFFIFNMQCHVFVPNFDDDDHLQASVTVHTRVVSTGIRRRPASNSYSGLS